MGLPPGFRVEFFVGATCCLSGWRWIHVSKHGLVSLGKGKVTAREGRHRSAVLPLTGAELCGPVSSGVVPPPPFLVPPFYQATVRVALPMRR